MHLVLINQFYPPDVAPTGVYLHDVAAELARRGHAVTVLCSRRAYGGGERYATRDTLDGVRIVRLPACGFGRATTAGKLLDYASFTVSLLAALLAARPRPDAVLTLTTPPYAGVVARLAGGLRRYARLHWVMDVYPDVLAAHGGVPPGSLRYALLRALSRFQYRGCRLVVSLGEDMSARIGSLMDPADRGRLRAIPLWSHSLDLTGGDGTDADAAALRRTRGWDGKLVFLYAGNVGPGHRIDEFLELAVTSDPAYAGCLPHVVFSGGGKRSSEVRRFRETHGDARLEMLDYVPASVLNAHLRSADVLLAGLEPAWAGCILPSKAQAAMGAGRPLLYVGPAHGDIAGWVRESGAGWTVEPGDRAALLQAVRQAADPGVRAAMGAAGRAYARRRFDRDNGVSALCGWVEESLTA